MIAQQFFNRSNLLRIQFLGLRFQVRCTSILGALHSSPVLISSNHDVFTNLALEHWLYKNLKFNHETDSMQVDRGHAINFNHPIVFMWTNEPCVVIGRHQNPWVETHLNLLEKLGVKLARRHSGGGCVYHDENNINISIIGNRKIFDDRQQNLRFLASVLDSKYGINCEPNKRHDLIHIDSGHKMSGSAAKLGRYNSYHHFTLLVNTDKEILDAVIRPKNQDFINTNSTMSTRSKVINLSELKPDLGVEQVLFDLAQAYGKLYKSDFNGSDEGKFDASGTEYKNLSEIRAELMRWDWTHGMTPRFKMARSILLLYLGNKISAELRVCINRGSFEDIEIDCDSEEVRKLASKFDHLIGTRFIHRDAIISIVKMLDIQANAIVQGNEQLLATHLLQMIHEANV